jgi:hypothetical protein
MWDVPSDQAAYMARISANYTVSSPDIRTHMNFENKDEKNVVIKWGLKTIYL